MRTAIRRLLPLGLIGLLCAPNPPGSRDAKAEENLWAAVTVSTPILDWDAFTVDPFMVYFGLVNDGEKTVNPEITASQLLVNGKVLKEWPLIVGRGLSTDQWEKLPPKTPIAFGYNLGKYFEKPGVYRLVWKGKTFESLEVMFRVMLRRKQ